MTEKSVYTALPTDITLAIESKKLDLESGVLGKFFGSSKSAASNISGVMLFLFTCAGIIILFVSCATSFAEYWKTVGPFATLTLGYLFGRKTE